MDFMQTIALVSSASLMVMLYQALMVLPNKAGRIVIAVINSGDMPLRMAGTLAGHDGGRPRPRHAPAAAPP
jgi:hypothetical protein